MYQVGEEEIEAIARVIRRRRCFATASAASASASRRATPTISACKHFALAASGSQRSPRR